MNADSKPVAPPLVDEIAQRVAAEIGNKAFGTDPLREILHRLCPTSGASGQDCGSVSPADGRAGRFKKSSS